MIRRRPWFVLIALSCCVAASSACGGGAEPTTGELPDGEGRVALTVAPFELPEVEQVLYRLVVEAAGDEAMETVVARNGVLSDGPKGSLTWIAPCDADGPNGEKAAQVTVEVLQLQGADGEPLEAMLPPPLVKQFTCRNGRDVPVQFDISVMRPARSGFTDLIVDIDEVFCSAKADCDPELITDDNGTRGVGLVTGLACHSNGLDDPDLLQTLVYAADLRCEDATDVTHATEHFTGIETLHAQRYHNTATGFANAAFAGAGCELDAVAWLYARQPEDPMADELITPIPIITWAVRSFDNEPLCDLDANVDAAYAGVGFVYDVAMDAANDPATTKLSLLLVGGEDPNGLLPSWLVVGYDEATEVPEAFVHGSLTAYRDDAPAQVRVAGAHRKVLDGEPLICVEVLDDVGFGVIPITRDASGAWFCLGDTSDGRLDPVVGTGGGRCDIVSLDAAPCTLLPVVTP
ncbi:MAG: hypothetical protein EP329_26250 [Deltaproteobacteria bacterium]|nr:MAG: hypothetical protein EP329_26250 [Deltaproteobacteria bacterium]